MLLDLSNYESLMTIMNNYVDLLEDRYGQVESDEIINLINHYRGKYPDDEDARLAADLAAIYLRFIGLLQKDVARGESFVGDLNYLMK